MEVKPEKSINSFALITGGSKGIGKAIAIELAKRKYNLILIDRSLKELSLLAAEIKTGYQVIVKFYAIDLSSPLAPKFIYELLLTEKVSISVLVNNAGFAIYGKFSELSWQEQSLMLQANVASLVQLTHLILPLLKRNSEGYILNVASIAAYSAIHSLTLYAACKSFILSFSRRLRQEEKINNIFVTSLCAGPVNTNFINRAKIQQQELTTEGAKLGMAQENVARMAVKGMFAKKGEIIPGFINSLSASLLKIISKD